MWNSKDFDQYAVKIPALYSLENVPAKNKIIEAHFFVGGCDWYVCEYDKATDIAFGFTILAGHCGEWGYINVADLRQFILGLKIQVDYDKYWKTRPACLVDRIKPYLVDDDENRHEAELAAMEFDEE